MNNEFDWIESVTPKEQYHSSLKVGIGDDAAIISHESHQESVVAVDTMVEGVHFTKETMPIKSIGYKVLAVNLSDLAAMGASPLYYLVSISIPKKGWSQAETTEIYAGMMELASKWKIDMIGGDTVSTEGPLVLTVTAIGQVEKGKRLLRSNAKDKDILFTTGELGLSAYGLEQLLNKGKEANNMPAIDAFLQAHQQPVPQLTAGQLLAKSGCRIALNDISDGIAHEAKEIAISSNVDIVIEWDKLSLQQEFLQHPLEKQEDWVLYGGEDFQLVGATSPSDYEKIKSMFHEYNLPLYSIGYVKNGKGQVFLNRNGKQTMITKTGYHHF